MNTDIIATGESDLALVTELPVSKEQARVESEAEHEEVQIKSFAQSPGWQIVRQQFLDEIERVSKFDYVDLDGDNEKIGERVKVDKRVAAALAGFIARVDETLSKEEEDE
jgi:hypothetical protein